MPIWRVDINGRVIDVSSVVDSVVAVLVLFCTDITASPSVAALVGSGSSATGAVDLIVYDNSPYPWKGPWDMDMPIHYLHDPTNPGVSKAYNEAAKIAKKMGKKWLLFLDQDTSLPIDAVEKYAEAVIQHPGERMFAPVLEADSMIVSPCAVYSGIGISLRRQVRGRIPLRNRSILNSGMLVNLESFEAIGGFNENIPLDFADHDFCRRFARRYGSAYILDMVCQHGFSDRETTSLDNDLARFAFYCRGARNSIASIADVAGHTVAVLNRCLILCRRHGTSRFWNIVRREYVKK